MKIYEVTGQGQPQKMKVVQAAPNKVVLQNPMNQAQTTIDPSKLGPAGIQQGPEGVTINTAANPNQQPQGPQLKPGEEVDVVGTGIDAPSQPGSPLTPNPQQNQGQEQAAAEDLTDVEEMQVPVEDGYYPTGYNDKNREKAMMRKAFQQVVQNEPYFEEQDKIIKLARLVSNVQVKNSNKQSADIIDIKKLAGL
jgi:hypothetical protein